MDRQTLATAQVLPAIKRTIVNQPAVVGSSVDHARAAKLAREAVPMYEGYMVFAELYMHNVAIMGMRKVEIGEE